MADSSSPEKPCACIDLTVTPQSEVEDSADKGADKGPAAEEIVLKLESNEIDNESKVPTTNGHGKRRREDKGDDKRPLKLPVGLGSAGRSAAAPVGIRTAETLAQEYDKNNETGLLPTIPGGPWQGADAVDATTILKKEIKRWANDLHTGGGGHAVYWEGFRSANTVRGSQRTAFCKPAGDDHVKCPWKARFEYSIDSGWILVDGNKVHMCKLIQTQGQANARHATRIGIP